MKILSGARQRVIGYLRGHIWVEYIVSLIYLHETMLKTCFGGCYVVPNEPTTEQNKADPTNESPRA